MSQLHTPAFLAALLLVAVVLLLGVVPASGQCASCPASNANTFQLPLAHNESYVNFYTWITNVLGKESTPVSRQWIDQYTTSPNVYFNDSRPDAQCHINVSFVNEYAGFRSRVGSFQFDRDAQLGRRVLNSTIRTVFEDATANILTNDTAPCLAYGATVTLGPFGPQSSVGFFLDQNAMCSSNPMRLWSLDDENAKYNTAGWNPSAKPFNRTIAVLRDPTTGNTFLGFEDVVSGGDQDYNDVILYLTWNCTVDESRLPCYNSCRYASQMLLSQRYSGGCLRGTQCCVGRHHVHLCAHSFNNTNTYANAEYNTHFDAHFELDAVEFPHAVGHTELDAHRVVTHPYADADRVSHLVGVAIRLNDFCDVSDAFVILVGHANTNHVTVSHLVDITLNNFDDHSDAIAVTVAHAVRVTLLHTILFSLGYTDGIAVSHFFLVALALDNFYDHSDGFAITVGHTHAVRVTVSNANFNCISVFHLVDIALSLHNFYNHSNVIAVSYPYANADCINVSLLINLVICLEDSDGVAVTDCFDIAIAFALCLNLSLAYFVSNGIDFIVAVSHADAVCVVVAHLFSIALALNNINHHSDIFTVLVGHANCVTVAQLVAIALALDLNNCYDHSNAIAIMVILANAYRVAIGLALGNCYDHAIAIAVLLANSDWVTVSHVVAVAVLVNITNGFAVSHFFAVAIVVALKLFLTHPVVIAVTVSHPNADALGFILPHRLYIALSLRHADADFNCVNVAHLVSIALALNNISSHSDIFTVFVSHADCVIVALAFYNLNEHSNVVSVGVRNINADSVTVTHLVDIAYSLDYFYGHSDVITVTVGHANRDCFAVPHLFAIDLFLGISDGVTVSNFFTFGLSIFNDHPDALAVLVGNPYTNCVGIAVSYCVGIALSLDIFDGHSDVITLDVGHNNAECVSVSHLIDIALCLTNSDGVAISHFFAVVIAHSINVRIAYDVVIAIAVGYGVVLSHRLGIAYCLDDPLDHSDAITLFVGHAIADCLILSNFITIILSFDDTDGISISHSIFIAVVNLVTHHHADGVTFAHFVTVAIALNNCYDHPDALIITVSYADSNCVTDAQLVDIILSLDISAGVTLSHFFAVAIALALDLDVAFTYVVFIAVIIAIIIAYSNFNEHPNAVAVNVGHANADGVTVTDLFSAILSLDVVLTHFLAVLVSHPHAYADCVTVPNLFTVIVALALYAVLTHFVFIAVLVNHPDSNLDTDSVNVPHCFDVAIANALCLNLSLTYLVFIAVVIDFVITVLVSHADCVFVSYLVSVALALNNIDDHSDFIAVLVGRADSEYVAVAYRVAIAFTLGNCYDHSDIIKVSHVNSDRATLSHVVAIAVLVDISDGLAVSHFFAVVIVVAHLVVVILSLKLFFTNSIAIAVSHPNVDALRFVLSVHLDIALSFCHCGDHSIADANSDGINIALALDNLNEHSDVISIDVGNIDPHCVTVTHLLDIAHCLDNFYGHPDTIAVLVDHPNAGCVVVSNCFSISSLANFDDHSDGITLDVGHNNSHCVTLSLVIGIALSLKNADADSVSHFDCVAVSHLFDIALNNWHANSDAIAVYVGHGHGDCSTVSYLVAVTLLVYIAYGFTISYFLTIALCVYFLVAVVLSLNVVLAHFVVITVLVSHRYADSDCVILVDIAHSDNHPYAIWVSHTDANGIAVSHLLCIDLCNSNDVAVSHSFNVAIDLNFLVIIAVMVGHSYADADGNRDNSLNHADAVTILVGHAHPDCVALSCLLANVLPLDISDAVPVPHCFDVVIKFCVNVLVTHSIVIAVWVSHPDAIGDGDDLAVSYAVGHCFDLAIIVALSVSRDVGFVQCLTDEHIHNVTDFNRVANLELVVTLSFCVAHTKCISLVHDLCFTHVLPFADSHRYLDRFTVAWCLAFRVSLVGSVAFGVSFVVVIASCLIYGNGDAYRVHIEHRFAQCFSIRHEFATAVLIAHVLCEPHFGCDPDPLSDLLCVDVALTDRVSFSIIERQHNARFLVRNDSFGFSILNPDVSVISVEHTKCQLDRFAIIHAIELSITISEHLQLSDSFPFSSAVDREQQHDLGTDGSRRRRQRPAALLALRRRRRKKEKEEQQQPEDITDFRITSSINNPFYGEESMSAPAVQQV